MSLKERYFTDCYTTNNGLCILSFEFDGIIRHGSVIAPGVKPWCATKMLQNGSVELSVDGTPKYSGTCKYSGCRPRESNSLDTFEFKTQLTRLLKPKGGSKCARSGQRDDIVTVYYI